MSSGETPQRQKGNYPFNHTESNLSLNYGGQFES